MAMWKVWDSYVSNVTGSCIGKDFPVMSKSLYDWCLEREDFALLAQWDKEKNTGLHPKDICFDSRRMVWWKCFFGHQCKATVASHRKLGCPYCAGKKTDSLAQKHPELVRQWHPTKNIGLTPYDVSPGTHKKVWWRCVKGHEWQAQVNARVNGTGCPYCSNRRIKVGENDLATTHPELAAQWHQKRNGKKTPQSVVSGNHAKVWWKCEKGHEWQATILSRTTTGNGCPVCTGKLVIAGQNDLASRFPQIAAQWHPTKNGDITPESVTAFSNLKVWWLCEKGHAYESVIAHRSQSGSGCPFCANRRVLAGFNDLATVESEVAAQWHSELNGTLTPQMVTAGSGKKVWWQCSEGHVWQAAIYSRTGPQKHGCPVCAGKVKRSRLQGYGNSAGPWDPS